MTREEAIDVLIHNYPSTCFTDLCEAVEIAIQALSAQPERKKGKWIEVDDYYNRISGRCSICGWEALLYETDVVGMDFCPNCGADMRGDNDA